MRPATTIALPLMTAVLLSCGDATAPGDGGRVTLRFTMAPGMAAMQSVTGGPSLSRLGLASLPLEGTNGTLTLDELWLIVRKVVLTPVEGSCDAAEDDGDAGGAAATSRVSFHGGFPEDGHDGDDRDDCRVTLGPFFVQVPLEGDGSTAVSVDVVPGTYTEVELKTGAPKDDADPAFLDGIRDQFDDWPEDASMLVEGSFTPTEGDGTSFRVYFRARIEVEREFADDPLMVEEGGDLTVTVTVDPMPWFTNGDGTVDDLTAYDFGVTGEVVDLGERSYEGCHIDREHD